MGLTEKFGVDSHERDQRKRFIHLTDEDILLLQELLPFMKNHVDKIVEEFYAHLIKYAEVRAFFADERALSRVKSLQREYLLDLFRGNYDEGYFERRLQIGVVHERIGLVPKWYIGSNSNFMGLIIPLLAQRYIFRPKKMTSSILALIKIMNLDQQLVIDTYTGSLVDRLKELGRQIGEAVNLLASSASEIVATSTQVASGATETAAAVTETASTSEEVKQTAQVSNQKAKYVSESAQKAAQATQVGKKSVEESVEGMTRIREQMGSIAESVMRLSEQSQAIGEIIATVDDLAGQSNLLAVNASIEAARAGEQGKGFAVVAQEVKSLAEQSRQATSKIRTILTDVQKAMSSMVMVTEQGSKAAEAGVRQVAEAGEAIRTLADSVTEAAQAAIQIAASSQQQLVGMDQVALAMENIKQASTQNISGMKQLETAAQNLQGLGQKLNQLVEQYKV